jgi:hypothetical protein
VIGSHRGEWEIFGSIPKGKVASRVQLVTPNGPADDDLSLIALLIPTIDQLQEISMT